MFYILFYIVRCSEGFWPVAGGLVGRGARDTADRGGNGGTVGACGPWQASRSAGVVGAVPELRPRGGQNWEGPFQSLPCKGCMFELHPWVP